MKCRIPLYLAFLAFTISANATTLPPALILCTPEEHYRTGIETLDLPGATAQLFDYGGKVTITQNGNQSHYSYGEGQDFYNLKEKTAYSNNFINIQHDVFLYSDHVSTDDNHPLVLRGQMGNGFFYIDWSKRRYYGYTHESGAIHSYAGSCTVLKK